MPESILKKLLESNPAFAKTMKSKQYRHSKALIRMKHELGLNQYQMAQLLELPYSEYLELEFSSLVIPVSAYEAAFARLSKITDTDILATQTTVLTE